MLVVIEFFIWWLNIRLVYGVEYFYGRCVLYGILIVCYWEVDEMFLKEYVCVCRFLIFKYYLLNFFMNLEYVF